MSQTTAWFTPAWLIGAAVALAGCTESRLYVSDDFGLALRQDQVAQVADPDAHYKGWPPAASNGARAGIAQARYEQNAVIRPVSMTTSNVSAGGAGGGSPNQ